MKRKLLEKGPATWPQNLLWMMAACSGAASCCATPVHEWGRYRQLLA